MTECNKVLITGMAALDIVILCEKYPEEDEKGKATAHYKQKGGNAANTAEILSRLGAKTYLFSYFEKEEDGTFVKTKLEKCGVDTSLCVLQEGPGFPTSYCILSQETCSRTILHSRSRLYEPKFDDFVEKLKGSLHDYSWLHFEGRGFPDVCQILQYLRNEKKQILSSEIQQSVPITSKRFTISIELERVKSKDELLSGELPYTDVAFISKDFATSLGYKSAKDAATRIKSDQKLSDDVIIIVPWGEEGADAIDSNNVWHHCNSYPPSKVFDTIGAGDTFNAAIIYCLMNGQSLPDALKYGCQLAGKKCGMYGFQELI